MVDPSILDTNAKIIEKDFLDKIGEGPEYMCEKPTYWNYKKSVSRLNIERYDAVVFEKSFDSDGNEPWICHSCDRFLKKKKMPPKAHANYLELNPKYKQLEDLLCLIELTLISQIIPVYDHSRQTKRFPTWIERPVCTCTCCHD